MNFHRFTYKNSIWQLGDMRAGRRPFVAEPRLTLHLQGNQCHKTHQRQFRDDRCNGSGIKQ
jgi:hypothetical protein